jgi:hypothetical protein
MPTSTTARPLQRQLFIIPHHNLIHYVGTGRMRRLSTKNTVLSHLFDNGFFARGTDIYIERLFVGSPAPVRAPVAPMETMPVAIAPFEPVPRRWPHTVASQTNLALGQPTRMHATWAFVQFSPAKGTWFLTETQQTIYTTRVLCYENHATFNVSAAAATTTPVSTPAAGVNV